MKAFSEALERLGYVFAVHDNYRDYYRDAASFDERFAIQNEEGSHPGGNTWFGGAQTILCAQLAPGHVARNHRALLEHGIRLKGAYLDVFSIVPGDECYNPEHPASRAECVRQRAKCLELITALEGIASSEEPCDWAVPYIDLVHHAPYALDPNPGGGPAIGIPVPLFSLVYHDAVLIPWTMTKGGWGIPSDDWGYLHALLNGGLPYLDVEPKDEDLERVRTACALARRVGLAAMTSHEFADGAASPRRQRSRFADGTSVTVDFAKDQFEIDPPLTPSELAESLSSGR